MTDSFLLLPLWMRLFNRLSLYHWLWPTGRQGFQGAQEGRGRCAERGTGERSVLTCHYVNLWKKLTHCVDSLIAKAGTLLTSRLPSCMYIISRPTVLTFDSYRWSSGRRNQEVSNRKISRYFLISISPSPMIDKFLTKPPSCTSAGPGRSRLQCRLRDTLDRTMLRTPLHPRPKAILVSARL